MKNWIISYQERNPIKTWIIQSKHSHKLRGYNFLCSIKEIEILVDKTNKCLYCGRELIYDRGNRTDKKYLNGDTASIDIIDVSKPIDINNIQIICLFCNKAKGILNTQEFIEWIKSIISNFKYPEEQ